MTPKEKAYEIMESFNFGGAWGELAPGQKIDYAIVAVNLVLLSIRNRSDYDPTFWKEVKQELESL